MDISVESVCRFIVDHGGKVKNTVLVSHFKKTLNNPATKEAARQKFKECVNAVAVVKNENGEKYVQLKKKFRTGSSTTDSPRPDPNHSPQDGSLEQPKVNESIESQDASFSATDTFSCVDKPDGKSTRNPEDKPIEEVKQRSPSKKHKKRDKSPHHKPSPPKVQEPKEEVCHDNRSIKAPQTPEKKQFIEEVTHFKYERRPSKDDRFDVIGSDKVAAAKASLQEPTDKAEFAVPNAAPLRKKKKENTPPSPNPEQRWTSVDRAKSSLMNIAGTENRMSRMRPTSVVQGSYAGSVERVRQNFQTKQKANEDAASLAPSERSLDSKGEELDEEYDRNIPSVALDMNEKLWIIRSAQGDLVEMRILLDADSTLVEKRDFIMNALHWAAKKGNIEMLEMLLDQKIDINCRTGYTALHLAAMNGHEKIISRLLDYGADMNVRDYSGHKPIHYLKATADNPFGVDFNLTETIKDPATRTKNQGVRKSQYRISSALALSGGLLLSKSFDDLATENDPKFLRNATLKPSKIGKMKKSRKTRDERPTISVVSMEDSDSGFVNLSNQSLSGLALASATSMNIKPYAP